MARKKQKPAQSISEAKKWEAEQDAAIWKQETSTVCLLDVATAYLDYSKARHHPATYKAKKLSIKRLFSYVKPDAAPEDVTPKIALAYMMDRQTESGKQEMLCLPVRKLPAYLASINPNKVREELRPKIELYQAESDDALWNYWMNGKAATQGKPGRRPHHAAHAGNHPDAGQGQGGAAAG